MLYFIDFPLKSNPNWLLLGTEAICGLLISLLGIRLWTQLTPMISYLCAFGVSSMIFFEVRTLDPALSNKVIFGASVISGMLYTLVSFVNKRVATIGMLQFTMAFVLRLLLANLSLSSSLLLIVSLIVLTTAFLLSFLLVMGGGDKMNQIANVALTSLTGTCLLVLSTSWLVAAYDSGSMPWILAIQQHPMPRPSLGMILTLVTGLLFFCISSMLQYFCFVKPKYENSKRNQKSNKNIV